MAKVSGRIPAVWESTIQRPSLRHRYVLGSCSADLMPAFFEAGPRCSVTVPVDLPNNHLESAWPHLIAVVCPGRLPVMALDAVHSTVHGAILSLRPRNGDGASCLFRWLLQ
jgi:hypothetical protein